MERAINNVHGMFWDFVYEATVFGLGIAATAAVVIQFGRL